jgi:hypothetical protein
VVGVVENGVEVFYLVVPLPHCLFRLEDAHAVLFVLDLFLAINSKGGGGR